MSSTTTASYAHDPLDSPDHIRLLELVPGDLSTPISALVHQMHLPQDNDDNSSMAPSPTYTALSYMWGPDVKQDESPVWLDGEPFLVRPNLLAALRRLRAVDEAVTLWVDAICINQADVYEKNHQVGRMGRISRAARVVKIWLGSGIEDGETDVRKAIEYIQSREGKELLDGGGSDDSQTGRPVPIQAIEALLAHEYWSRAWIIQEIMLATEIDVLYGTLTLRWDELVQVRQLVRLQLPRLSATRLMDQRSALVMKQSPLLAQTLESLIRTHHQAKCSEKRDRVFAFLSLASDCAFGHGLKPDYLTPRLTLLVQVLEFCRPADPISFISTLFVALANDNDNDQDSAWDKAARHWANSSRNPTTPGSNFVMLHSNSDGSEVVQMTHFVTASSTSRDWARSYTFPAVLDRHIVDQDTNRSNFEAVRMIQNRVEAARSLRYQGRVCRLDDWQIGVLLHEHHYVVFSTSRMIAAESPCNALGLHAKEQSCSFAHCGLLRPA